ncbi:MAG: TadA family conjugal transfer-associated ATPase [Spirochaetaceae bacterium]|nr:TadA family conjugal transfer-associated ATPase [Spirochaetaceae bacterium]
MTAGVAPGGSELVDRVADRLARTGSLATPGAVAAALRAEGSLVAGQAVLDIVGAVRSELTGAGPLDDLLADPEVSDVLVNGPEEVWVDRGGGLVRVGVRFRDDAAVRRLAQRLAASAGRRLDLARPTVDARLRDGTRLHAVLPPVSPTGTLISLRTSRRRAFTLEDLVSRETVAPGLAEVLRDLVRARASFLVTGGTGTGKTTLLSTLLSLAAPTQRLVLVEDSGELRPDHPHVVRLEARQANVEGQGEVDLRDLVRQALRMRPDRLVVGEVRGGEVVELLAALNTGHEGGCGTVHANTAAALPARIEALALAAGLGRDAAHSQLAAGLDAVVHLVRDRRGARRVAEVGVLQRGPDGLVHVVTALTPAAADGRLARGPGAGRLDDLTGRSRVSAS